MNLRLGKALLAAAAAFGQSPAFEVVSVKISNAENTASDVQRDPGGGIVLKNVNLRTLMLMAYNIQPFQLAGGPTWLRSKRFDIAARAPAGTRKDQTWVMLQTLLAERFQLTVHKETRELPVFEMTLAKGGLKIQPAHRVTSPAEGGVTTFVGGMKASMASMSSVALVLSGMLGHQVIDRTGVEGRYDFDFEYAPEGSDSGLPSIYSALQDRLGLKLETGKGPVEVIVIDRAELPAGN